MKRPEQALHIQVADFLRLALGGTAMFFHVPNAARRGLVEGRMFKSMGVKAGMVDLMIIDGGRAYGIELKAAKGRVSETQESAHRDLKRAGCPVAVCKTLDDVAAFLAYHGIAVKAQLV